MQEECKQAVGNSQAFVTLLRDLSKAFDCKPYELLIAKSNTHGFSLKALKMMNNYLFQKNQRKKSFSSWEVDSLGVPQCYV